MKNINRIGVIGNMSKRIKNKRLRELRALFRWYDGLGKVSKRQGVLRYKKI